MRFWILIAAALVLSGCEVDALERLVKWNQIGSSQDVWLVKGAFTEDRVALVFGYMDDYAACLDIANGLNAQFTAANYYCLPVGP